MQGRLFSFLGALIALGVWLAVLSGGAAAIRGRESQPAADFQLETPDISVESPSEEGAAPEDELVPAFPETPAQGTTLGGNGVVTPGDGAAIAPVDKTPANAQPAEDPQAEPRQAAVRTVDPAIFALPSDVQGQPLERLPAAQPATEPTKTKPRSLVLRRPLVLAAGRVRFGEREVTLSGIAEVPEDRTCEAEGRRWDCGKAAKLAFRNHLRARALVCTVPRADWSGAIDAACTVGGDDPARWLAEQGWAEAPAGSPLAGLTQAARKEGRGLFARTPPAEVPADLPEPVPDVTATPDLTDPTAMTSASNLADTPDVPVDAQDAATARP